MNSLKKKGLLSLGVLSVAVLLAAFTTVSHAQVLRSSSAHVAQTGDTDAGAACGGIGDSQAGDCTTASGDQSGDQTGLDNGAIGVEG
jgi:hypothetical protein